MINKCISFIFRVIFRYVNNKNKIKVKFKKLRGVVDKTVALVAKRLACARI